MKRNGISQTELVFVWFNFEVCVRVCICIYPWKPFGLFDCHLHESATASSNVNSAFQPKSILTLVGSLKQVAESPGRRGRILNSGNRKWNKKQKQHQTERIHTRGCWNEFESIFRFFICHGFDVQVVRRTGQFHLNGWKCVAKQHFSYL